MNKTFNWVTGASDMARHAYRVFVMLAATLALGACAGIGTVPPAPQVLDVGIADEPQVALPARAAMVVLPVEPAPLLRGDGVIWREKGSLQPSAYASFQWASPPADLFGQRLRERLSVEGPVVEHNVSGSLPEIRVYLEKFEQVFDPAARGEGQPVSTGEIALRAVLAHRGQVIDQLRFALSVPAATGDATGGARALRAAVDAATESIAQWLSQQPVLRGASGG